VDNADASEPTAGSDSSGTGGTSSNFPFVMYGGPSSQDENTGRFVRQYVMRGNVKPRGTTKRKPRSRNSPTRALVVRTVAASRSLRIPLQSKLSLYQIGCLGAGRSDPFARFPTKWTTKAGSFSSIVSNLSCLLYS
jgi:hypothetical protein